MSFEPGAVVLMTSCQIVSEDGSTRISYAPTTKGDRMVFLLLGSQPKKGPPLDPVAALKAMGWTPPEGMK